MNTRNLLMASAKGAIYNQIGAVAFKNKYGTWVGAAIGADADDYLENLASSTLPVPKKYMILHSGFITAINQGIIKPNDPIYGLTSKQIFQIGQTIYYISGTNFIAKFIDGANTVVPQLFNESVHKIVPFSHTDGTGSSKVATGTRENSGAKTPDHSKEKRNPTDRIVRTGIILVSGPLSFIASKHISRYLSLKPWPSNLLTVTMIAGATYAAWKLTAPKNPDKQ